MKNLFLFFAVSLFAIVGCQKNAVDPEPANPNKPPIDTTEQDTTQKGDSIYVCLPLKITVLFDGGKAEATWEYDASRREIGFVTAYDDVIFSEQYNYTHDSEGRVSTFEITENGTGPATAQLTYNSFGDTLSFSRLNILEEWTYDVNGREIGFKRTDVIMSEFYEEKNYQYDSQGNLISFDGYLTSGYLTTVTYTYDASNRRLTKLDPNRIRWVRTYDALGHILETNYYDMPIDMLAKTRKNFVYDEHDNIIQYNDDQLGNLSTTTITYDCQLMPK